MSELQGGDEVGLGQFLGFTFDHDHVVFGADVDEVQIAVRTLAVGRVGDELAIDAADAHGSHRAGERNVGNAESGAGAVDEEDIGVDVCRLRSATRR